LLALLTADITTSGVQLTGTGVSEVERKTDRAFVAGKTRVGLYNALEKTL